MNTKNKTKQKPKNLSGVLSLKINTSNTTPNIGLLLLDNLYERLYLKIRQPMNFKIFLNLYGMMNQNVYKKIRMLSVKRKRQSLM